MMKFRGPNKLLSGSLLLFTILSISYCQGQSNSIQDSLAPKIKFEHDTIDYGVILRNSNPYRYIKFSNTGKEPLLLTSVFSDIVSVVNYPKEPILPGQSTEIKIAYPTEKMGRFINFVAITRNTTPSQKIIFFRDLCCPKMPMP